MSADRLIFRDFLVELGLEDPDGLLERFELYHRLLAEQNAAVNLVSRASDPSQWWTKHFLDSLMPLKVLDLSQQAVLDFGSGGGLPGIPLKLVKPELKLSLLDSVGKKTRAIAQMASGLELKGVRVINARLEEHASSGQRYDLVLCRAVKMEERYRQPLYRLLASGGTVIFYKALDSSDLDGLDPKLLFQQDFSWGSRSLLSVERSSLKT